MTPKKPYWEMTTAELRRATKQYDAEFSADNLIPPPAEELAKWRRAKKKMGRPRVGQGAQQIAVTLERGLLRRTDRFARSMGLTRSATIAAALETMICHARPSHGATRRAG